MLFFVLCVQVAVKGVPSALGDVESVDWAPTVKLGYETTQSKSEASLQREQRMKLKEDQQRRSAMLDHQQTAESPGMSPDLMQPADNPQSEDISGNGTLNYQVLSEAPPAPPQNIHVDKWNLTWTPATEEGPVNYTVQYRSFDSTVWRNVEACVQINWMYCHVESTKAEAEHGCVMLRVQAGRWGLTSDPAQVCNRHGDSCTPEISLTAQPGSLTVHLNRSHGLALEYGDHAIHRVYYGKEGEPLKEFKDTASSVSIDKLQEGQRYCTKVQYIYYNTLVGLASCTQCELIPESGNPPKQTGVIVAVVVVIVMVILSLMVVLLISLRGRIKRCLRPPYQIPQNLISKPFLEHHNPICPSPSEERCDVISCISPDDLF